MESMSSWSLTHSNHGLITRSVFGEVLVTSPATEDSNFRLGGDDYDKNRKSKLGHASENRQATCHPQHQGEEVDQLREEPTPERCPGELSTILCLSGFRSQGQVDLDTT